MVVRLGLEHAAVVEIHDHIVDLDDSAVREHIQLYTRYGPLNDAQNRKADPYFMAQLPVCRLSARDHQQPLVRFTQFTQDRSTEGSVLLKRRSE